MYYTGIRVYSSHDTLYSHVFIKLKTLKISIVLIPLFVGSIYHIWRAKINKNSYTGNGHTDYCNPPVHAQRVNNRRHIVAFNL